MTKAEAERQLERAKVVRELAEIDREHADRRETRATELEIEALEVLSEEWRKEHAV